MLLKIFREHHTRGRGPVWTGPSSGRRVQGREGGYLVIGPINILLKYLGEIWGHFFRNKIPIWPCSQSSACCPPPRRSRWCWWSWRPSSPTSSSSSRWCSTLASAASTTTSSSASPSPTFLSPVLRWHSMRHKKFWAGECHFKSWGENKLGAGLMIQQPGS